jgi:DNA-binding CsgD family transcriptional regulator
MSAEVFGREAELQALRAFLNGVEHAAAAMVLAGSAGAGKTTLLRAGAELAAEHGYTVLTTAPARSDMRLAFAGLADLLGPHLGAVIDDLPGPQAAALRVALLLADAPASPPEPRLIATAFRSAVIEIANAAPVLVAVDDVQWLDSASENAVGFAMRRLEHERIGLLCAQRTDRPGADLPLELDRARMTCELVPVGGLSIGALHRMLRTQLGRSFPQPTLRRIEAESHGKPFIALEIGRALIRRGHSGTGVRPLPVPDTLNGLVDEHIAELPPAVRGGLELVAIMPDAPSAFYVAGGVAEADLDAAVEAGVLEQAGERMRFAHPLLRSAMEGMIPPGRLRELHAIAARLTDSPEDAVRHQALAVASQSAQVAASLEAAAEAAIGRGATRNAGDLYELAASLTPEDQYADMSRRIAEAGRLLTLAGNQAGAAAILERYLASAPAGAHRAKVVARLAYLHTDVDPARATALLREALAEATADPALTSDIHILLAEVMSRSGEPQGALNEAGRAVVAAEQAGRPELVAAAILTLCQMQLLDGRPVDQILLQRALGIEAELGTEACLENPPALIAGQVSFIEGQLEDAERHWRRLLAACDAAGLEYWRPDMFLRLSHLALCRGDLEAASALAAEGLEGAEQQDHPHTIAALLWVGAQAAAYRGDVDAARDLALRGMQEAAKASTPTFLLRNESVLGLLDLAQGHCQAAAERLAPLAVRWRSGAARFLVTTGIDVLAVEPLIGVGDLGQAASLIADMATTAHTTLGAAIIARCRGHIAAAGGDSPLAVAELSEALRLHDQISPHPLERGRILLLLGGVQLRLNERAAARATLTEALAIFDRAAARLWAERARSELARISGRAPAPADLTQTERRVAELVANGRSNKEAAAELFVSVRAIESTLTKAYAKLGVRSRTELAAALRQPGG